MAVFSRVLDLLSWLVIVLAGIAMVTLVMMMGWLVFGRYVLNDTPTWIERGATLSILVIGIPVAAVGVRERFHLSVVGFRDALPAAARRWVMLVCDACVGLFGLAMAWWGWTLVEIVGPFKIPLLAISQGWTYVPMVVGGVLIVLFATEQVLNDLLNPALPQRHADLAHLE